MEPSQNTSSQVSKTSKANLILAAVLVVAGSFAYWYEYAKKPQREKAESTKGKLFALDEDQEFDQFGFVNTDKKLTIDFKCLETCKANSANSKWQMAKPLDFKADDSNLSTFLNGIVSVSVSETLKIEGDRESFLKRYGLGSSTREAYKAYFRKKSDQQVTKIYFGDGTAIGENLYVYVEQPKAQLDEIYIVPGYFKNYFERPVSHWRGKKLFDFAASEIEKVALVNPSGQITLERKDAAWLMNGSVKTDAELAESFTTGIVFMTATDYLSDEKEKDRAKLKLTGKPKFTLSVFTKGGNKILDVFELKSPALAGAKKPTPTIKLYGILRDKNFIVEIDKMQDEKLGRKADYFKEKPKPAANAADLTAPKKPVSSTPPPALRGTPVTKTPPAAPKKK